MKDHPYMRSEDLDPVETALEPTSKVESTATLQVFG
jgi:hypothetical protein